jgi:hypothetical protein
MSWSESVLEMSNLSFCQAKEIAEEHGLKEEFCKDFNSKVINSHDLLDWLGY